MATMIIRDNAVWVKHIEGDAEIARRILALPESAPIVLIVDDKPILFRKMRDGSDGRATPGLRPDRTFKAFWDGMQERRGQSVSVRLEGQAPAADPYLSSIESLLSEWSSPEDGLAYDDL